MSYTLNNISTKKNPEQEEFARLINDPTKKVIYCTGNSGTGKTFIALAAALELVKNREYEEIIYTREPIEVGKSLGFLPGGLDEKFDVYLGGFYDNLQKISILSKITIENLEKKISCSPPQFMRGRSLDSKILIIDEAQNLSMNSIKTLLTRLEESSKAILLGSVDQIDIKGATKEKNDFIESYRKLSDLDAISFIELKKAERSELSKIIDERL